MKLTRAKLESLVGDLIKVLDQALSGRAERCGPVVGDIDEIVLVGGMTRMPESH